MDELSYKRLAAAAFRRVMDLFEDVDPEQADVESSGDVLRIELAGGQRVVLNTQRLARQIWLAGGKAAWHFSYDEASATWLDDKGRGELMQILRGIVHEASGLSL